MSFSPQTAEQLRDLFEDREAIYIEKGAVHVKVSGIHWNPVLRGIQAEVLELPTTGFPCEHYSGSCPRRWTIRAGYRTTFSQQTWDMGYGGWSLYFAPEIVNGVLSLASGFPKDLHWFRRYNLILGYLERKRQSNGILVSSRVLC
jgi:hypothetical protein